MDQTLNKIIFQVIANQISNGPGSPTLIPYITGSNLREPFLLIQFQFEKFSSILRLLNLRKEIIVAVLIILKRKGN